jgi:hypothetical protein
MLSKSKYGGAWRKSLTAQYVPPPPDPGENTKIAVNAIVE